MTLISTCHTNSLILALWIMRPKNFFLALVLVLCLFLVLCCQESRTLPLQGQLLGRMVPRCSDPLTDVRQTAVECIQLTLRIACCVPGNESGYTRKPSCICIYLPPLQGSIIFLIFLMVRMHAYLWHKVFGGSACHVSVPTCSG